jgi:hypothetical protein
MTIITTIRVLLYESLFLFVIRHANFAAYSIDILNLLLVLSRDDYAVEMQKKRMK